MARGSIELSNTQAGGKRKRRTKSKSNNRKRKSKSNPRKSKSNKKNKPRRRSRSSSKKKKPRRKSRSSSKKKKPKRKSRSSNKKKPKKRSKSKSRKSSSRKSNKRKSRKLKRGANLFIQNAVKVGELTGRKGPIAGMVLKEYADKLNASKEEKYPKAFDAIKNDYNNNKSKLDAVFKKAEAKLAAAKKNRKPRKSKK